MTRRHTARIGLGAAAMLASSARLCAQARFTDLGSLPGPFPHAEPLAISADGSTVVGMSLGMAFRWTEETGMLALQSVRPLPWVHFATGCSGDGSLIAGYIVDISQVDPFPQRAIVWNADGEATLLEDNEAFPSSAAFAVSADGTAIVGAWHETPTLWRPDGQRTPLAPIGGWATAVSPDGTVVAGTAVVQWGFRWSATTGLVPLGVIGTACRGVTADGGMIVGGFENVQGSPPWTQAFLWRPTIGVVLLGYLAGGRGTHSEALAVSPDGSRIVGTSDSARSSVEAFLWTAEDGLRSLPAILTKQHGLGPALQGWQVFGGVAISGDGTLIACNGNGPGSPSPHTNRAVLVRLPRCPGDYNRDGAFTTADVVAFVAAWFDSLAAGNDWGDFDLDEQVTPADVAAFVKAWYAAATGACP